MLGFLFGVGLSLFLMRRIGRGPWRSRSARHGGSRRSRHRRREWILNRMSSHLDTTPSQDKVLEDVVDDLMEVFGEQRSSFSSARSSLADILAAAEYDQASMDALKAEQDESLGAMHGAAGDALKRLHAVLDEEQRERLASFISRGPRGHHCRGRRRHLHAA